MHPVVGSALRGGETLVEAKCYADERVMSVTGVTSSGGNADISTGPSEEALDWHNIVHSPPGRNLVRLETFRLQQHAGDVIVLWSVAHEKVEGGHQLLEQRGRCV